MARDMQGSKDQQALRYQMPHVQRYYKTTGSIGEMTYPQTRPFTVCLMLMQKENGKLWSKPESSMKNRNEILFSEQCTQLEWEERKILNGKKSVSYMNEDFIDT